MSLLNMSYYKIHPQWFRKRSIVIRQGEYQTVPFYTTGFILTLVKLLFLFFIEILKIIKLIFIIFLINLTGVVTYGLEYLCSGRPWDPYTSSLRIMSMVSRCFR